VTPGPTGAHATKVLLTGAAGVLGKALTALLADDPGIELRLTDMVPMDTPLEFVQADLTNKGEVAPLCDGIDELVHPASVHPWKSYSSAQYLDCNVKGTYNILEAAAEGPVRRVIYTSSIAAMGMGRNEGIPLPWDESKPCIPEGHLYSITKHVGEQFCELFRQQGKLSYVALRPGTFIPMDERDPQFGRGLLMQWVHFSDVAAAHWLALRSTVENEAFVITAGVPFTNADSAALLSDARSVITRHYPRAAELAARGIELPRTIERCYDIGKAKRLLGYRPRYTFANWLEEVLSR